MFGFFLYTFSISVKDINFLFLLDFIKCAQKQYSFQKHLPFVNENMSFVNQIGQNREKKDKKNSRCHRACQKQSPKNLHKAAFLSVAYVQFFFTCSA